MKISSISRNSHACLWCKRLAQGALISGLLILNTTGIFKDYSFDGVARATVVKAPPPLRFKLTATPKRNNSSVIKVTEGQPVTIKLKAINSNDPKGLDINKVQSLKVELFDALPDGAIYTNRCVNDDSKTCGEGTLTWTPQLGDTDRYFGKLLTFVATNFYTNATAKQQVILQVQDNASPSFSDVLPSSLSTSVGTLQTLDIVATPGVIVAPANPKIDGKPHKLKILLDPETPLPKGAKLGKTHKGADGNWHRILSWKPKANQQGLSGSLRFYADNADVYSAATFSQAEYSVDYAVGTLASFSVSGVTVKDAAVTTGASGWKLSVQGQVETTTTLPAGLKVQLNFGDGTTPISVDTQNRGLPIIVDATTGAWSYNGLIDPKYGAPSGYRNLPCNVTAQLTYKGVTLDAGLVAVSGAGDSATNQCVDKPKCSTGQKWYVFQGSMAAMCM